MGELFRAWRQIHRYVVGLLVFIEVMALWSLYQFPTDEWRSIDWLELTELSVLIVVPAFALAGILGVLIVDAIWVLPRVLIARLATRRARTVEESGGSDLAWWELLALTSGHALRVAAERNRAHLRAHLELISLANLAKAGLPALSKEDTAYFDKVIATITGPSSDELLWWFSYAHQFTQERREIDSFALEGAIGRGNVVLSVLTAALVFALSGTLSIWLVVPVLLLALGISAFGVADWIDSRRKQIFYLLGMIIQIYAWGEQGAMQDRDAL